MKTILTGHTPSIYIGEHLTLSVRGTKDLCVASSHPVVGLSDAENKELNDTIFAFMNKVTQILEKPLKRYYKKENGK